MIGKVNKNASETEKHEFSRILRAVSDRRNLPRTGCSRWPEGIVCPKCGAKECGYHAKRGVSEQGKVLSSSDITNI